jgi:hypothetical protein
MSEVIGLNDLRGYLKSSKWVDDDPAYKGLKVIWGSNNSKIEEIFPKKLLDNNKRIEKSFSYWGNIGYDANGTVYSDPVYEDKEVYTISVSKFVKDETVPFPIIPYQYSRNNYTDYGAERTANNKGYGFAKILEEIDGGGFGGFDIRDFEGLKTQYRPGVNSIESLVKDPLFNPWRTNTDDIEWEGTGTQSQETGIYWDYFIEPGKTASVVGKYEDILLYNAFLEAGDDYKTITIPKKAPEPKVEPPVVSPLVPTTESKLSGEFTFNVEKKDTFVVVGNQNFALKIGDLVIEGLTTSSVIESPKTIDLGDGIIIIDDGESEEIDPYVENPYQGLDQDDVISIQLSEQRTNWEEETKKNMESNDQNPPLVGGTPIKDAKISEKIVILMNACIAAGYTVNQAAGIVGNVKAESGLQHWNVENGASNIRPGGMGSDRWDSAKAIGTNYAGFDKKGKRKVSEKTGEPIVSNFSGTGLCQWTYGARYQMEKFVGKYLTKKGVTTVNLKNEFFNTDPGLFSGGTDTIYNGAGDSLEKHLSSVPYLFEAQVQFLVEYWLVTGKPSVAKNLKGTLSGNTSTICSRGLFIHQTGGKPDISTVAGACEVFLCDGEVPGPVGQAVSKNLKKLANGTYPKVDSYIKTVNERVKCSMDVLATYNSNKGTVA